MTDAIPIIRRAGPDDLNGILDLYTHLHDADESVSSGVYRQRFEEILTNPGASLFLLEESGLFISSCILFVLPNLTRGGRPFGLIENVVTRKEFRGKGYASRLLSQALQTAWNADSYKVMLLTGRKEEHVFRLYENVGFIRGKKEGLIAFPP